MVGGGVIALLTAVEAVRAGHQVVIVDQGGIPNVRAASYDRHRVIRALHPSDPARTTAAVRAHHRWVELEGLLGARFYRQVGALTVLAPADVPRAVAELADAGSRARALTPAALASRYPQVSFPSGSGAVRESSAGVLLADRILGACAAWLHRHPGADLRPHRRAVGLDATGAVEFADGEMLRADAVLLAMGAWSRDLLAADLADELILYRQSMLYCDIPRAESAAWSTTPPMLALGSDRGAWFVPPVVGTPLKLSAASACRSVAEVGDDATPPRWRDHLVDTFTAVLPSFRADWVSAARDAYYLSRAPSGGTLLVEMAPSVLSFAACGGSSFKFAPLIAGSLLARLSDVDSTAGLAPLDHAVVGRPVSSARPMIRGA